MAGASTVVVSASASAGGPAADEAAPRDIRLGTYPYAVVFILMSMTTLSFMDRTILSLLIDPLKAAFRLDETQIGLLAGFAFALFYAVMGIPLARVADLGNRRNLIVLGVAGWSLATAACGFARGFGSLFAARAAVGIGEAALAAAAFSLIASYFPRPRIGLAMSLFAVGVTLGNGAAVTLGGLIVQWSRSHSVGRLAAVGEIDGWRLAFMVVACLGVPAVLLMLGVREPAREARPAWRRWRPISGRTGARSSASTPATPSLSSCRSPNLSGDRPISCGSRAIRPPPLA